MLMTSLPQLATAAATAGRERVARLKRAFSMVWQGARFWVVANAVLIFVLPPSIDIMMVRLKRRGTEPPEKIARRLISALDELQAVPEFDYVVVNDDLDECLAEIRGIVEQGTEPEAPELDADHFREEVARILESEYGPYMQDER